MQTPFGSGPRSLTPHTYPGSGPPYAYGPYGLAPHQAHQGAGGHHHGNGTWSAVAAQRPENFQRLPHQSGSPAHDGRSNYDARGCALGYDPFSGFAPAPTFNEFGNAAYLQPRPAAEPFNGFGAAEAYQQQQRAEAAAEQQQRAEAAAEQQRAEAAAEAGRMEDRFSAMGADINNLAGLMRQIEHRLAAATPSEGSEDSAASMPPMETPVPSGAASFIPSVPAGFVRATPPEPTPNLRPPPPEEHRPLPPEETRRTNAPAHWGRTPLSGREYEARAAPIAPEVKDQFKDIVQPRFGANWKTDLDPAKLGPWLTRLKGRLISHDIRICPVLEMNEHLWFNLTSTGDAYANWLIKANLWVSGQIVDQFDSTSKRVDNFFSKHAFSEYMHGRNLLRILEGLYNVTSGPELRAAELALERFVPFVMGMSADDAQHAAFEQLRLRGRLPPSSWSGAIGAESLLLFQKLPDEYTFKQTRLDEWYKGEVKNEPAWSLTELIKIIPQWLEKPPSARTSLRSSRRSTSWPRPTQPLRRARAAGRFRQDTSQRATASCAARRTATWTSAQSSA